MNTENTIATTIGGNNGGASSLPPEHTEKGEAAATASPRDENPVEGVESFAGPESTDSAQQVTLEQDLDNYHGILPAWDDPILANGPDDPVRARTILRMVENVEARNEEERKIYSSTAAPRTALALNHEDPWEDWKDRCRDHVQVQEMWRAIFGSEVPVMTVYEYRAVVRNVNQRLLYGWPDDIPPPCVTDCYDPIRGRYWRQGEGGRWNSYSPRQ